MKPGDIGIGIVLLAVMIVLWLPLFGPDDDFAGVKVAEIEVNGLPYETVPLTEEVREIAIKTERGYNLLRLSEGGIEMAEADCPDQLCLGFGHVHDLHETIVCLPNRVFIEVTGGSGGGEEIDAIVA